VAIFDGSYQELGGAIPGWRDDVGACASIARASASAGSFLDGEIRSQLRSARPSWPFAEEDFLRHQHDGDPERIPAVARLHAVGASSAMGALRSRLTAPLRLGQRRESPPAPLNDWNGATFRAALAKKVITGAREFF
jgi:hypothetical protein